MKLLILGGGNCQVNAILRAKQKGHTVIVSDYYEDAQGKAFCDYKALVSTFDVNGNIEIGRKYNIDGIMTMGTDQPVYTVAKVADALSLPYYIDVPTSKAVTNKKVMKNIFKSNDIPTVDFVFLKKGFSDDELKDIKFPVVIKPLDSQGQRGIYKLYSPQEIREHIDDTLSFSNEDEILVEKYYKHDEITVSGWVENDNVHILTVTDRVTYDQEAHIGICIAHDFPSKHLKDYYNEITQITYDIVNHFGIHNGPIYFQMLIGSEGIKVNEVACRLGGAYEDELIPLVTGVDILDLMIDFSLGISIDNMQLIKYDLACNQKKASVQLFFAKPGRIKSLGNMDDLKKLPGVREAKFNFKINDEILEITNATQRAGHMLIEGEDDEILKTNIKRAYDGLEMHDINGCNMIIKF